MNFMNHTQAKPINMRPANPLELPAFRSNEATTKPRSGLALVFLSLFILAFLPNNARAKLTQSIDRTDIHAGESFLLTLQIDTDSDSQPDLSLIPKEFTILSNSQYQQMNYINGQQSFIKGWKIKLSTLVTGKISIPAITVGNESTRPIHLVIKDTSHQVNIAGKKDAIFIETTVDNKQVYVQQQILLTVKLYRAVNTHYARLTEPVAGDSIIEKLGDDIQYDKIIGQTRYVVTERRYSIFAQKSGSLTIAAINFTADVNAPGQGRSRFLNTTRPISINSTPIKIKVAPQPSNTSSHWLPASEVVLVDKWSPTAKELKVGEPITWTLLLYAQGLSESQLPAITLPKVNGLQWYPDTAQKERQINDKGILGQRTEKLAVIPSKVGEITIPKVEIKWWDVKSNSEKIASIPARTIHVLPAEVTVFSKPTAEMIGPKIAHVVNLDETDYSRWKISSFILGTLWLLTLLLYFKLKRPVVHANSALPHNNFGSNRLKSNGLELNSLESNTPTHNRRQLLTAINQNQLETIERELLGWSSTVKGMQVHSLGELKKDLSSYSLSNEDLSNKGLSNKNLSYNNLISKISALEAARYSINKDEFQCNIDGNDLKIVEQSYLQLNTKENPGKIHSLYSRNLIHRSNHNTSNKSRTPIRMAVTVFAFYALYCVVSIVIGLNQGLDLASMSGNLGKACGLSLLTYALAFVFRFVKRTDWSWGECVFFVAIAGYIVVSLPIL